MLVMLNSWEFGRGFSVPKARGKSEDIETARLLGWTRLNDITLFSVFLRRWRSGKSLLKLGVTAKEISSKGIEGPPKRLTPEAETHQRGRRILGKGIVVMIEPRKPRRFPPPWSVEEQAA